MALHSSGTSQSNPLYPKAHVHWNPVGSTAVYVSVHATLLSPHGVVSHSFISVQGKVEQSNPAAGLHSNAPKATVPSVELSTQVPIGTWVPLSLKTPQVPAIPTAHSLKSSHVNESALFEKVPRGQP